MTNDYILIVGERDQERFRRFRTGYDRDIIKSMDDLDNISNIWALGASTSPDIWSSIQEKDRIFFADTGESFKHYGIISKKITDQSLAIKIWGDSPRIREHKRIILFSAIYDIDISFYKLCQQAGIDQSSKFTNIYPAKNLSDKIDKSIHGEFAGIIMMSDNGPANKKSEVVTRFIRDTKKVKQLKSIYNNECQICSRTIFVSTKSRYSEVHHIRPLGDGGDDDFDNMLVLCPTHHVEFDYKIIGIDDDKKTISDRDRKKIKTLIMAKEHNISEKNIRFHRIRMNEL